MDGMTINHIVSIDHGSYVNQGIWSRLWDVHGIILDSFTNPKFH